VSSTNNVPLNQEIINTNNILVVTSENISGYKITKVLGAVFGLTSRARKNFSDFSQGLEALISDEIRDIQNLNTSLVTKPFTDCIMRLRMEALTPL
jgi:uncharacterized protein YbjQ (UPF0145 family)